MKKRLELEIAQLPTGRKQMEYIKAQMQQAGISLSAYRFHGTNEKLIIEGLGHAEMS